MISDVSGREIRIANGRDQVVRGVGREGEQVRSQTVSEAAHVMFHGWANTAVRRSQSRNEKGVIVRQKPVLRVQFFKRVGAKSRRIAALKACLPRWPGKRKERAQSYTAHQATEGLGDFLMLFAR